MTDAERDLLLGLGTPPALVALLHPAEARWLIRHHRDDAGHRIKEARAMLWEHRARCPTCRPNRSCLDGRDLERALARQRDAADDLAQHLTDAAEVADNALL